MTAQNGKWEFKISLNKVLVDKKDKKHLFDKMFLVYEEIQHLEIQPHNIAELSSELKELFEKIGEYCEGTFIADESVDDFEDLLNDLYDIGDINKNIWVEVK